jgi:hypothetical protein
LNLILTLEIMSDFESRYEWLADHDPDADITSDG